MLGKAATRRRRGGWPFALLQGLLVPVALLATPAGAQEFEPPVAVTSAAGASNPHAAVDGVGVVHVAWSERTGGGSVAPYTVLQHARSFDRGQSFGAPVALEVGGTYTSTYDVRLAARGTALYAAWVRSDKGNPGQLYFARSLDGGRSFQSAVFLAGLPQAPYHSRIAVAPDGTIVVAWIAQGASGPSLVMVRRSLDGGATFEEGQSVGEAAAGYRTVANLEVAVNPVSGSVFVAWDDVGPAGLQQIRLARAADSGATFAPPLVVSSAAVDARHAGLAVGPSGRVHLVWEQATSAGALASVAYAQSTDDGVSFTAPTVLDPGDRPWIAEAPNAVVTLASRQGGDILVKSSSDGGVSFGAGQNVSATASPSLTPRATYAADSTLYVLWQEESQGILLRRAFAPGGSVGPAPGPPPGGSSLAVSVTVSQSTFASGQTLVMSAGVGNPGLGLAVDFYLGVLLPGSDTIVSVTTGEAVVGHLSNVATLAPLATAVSLAQAFAVSVPGLMAHTWAGSEPPGTYLVFLAAVLTGAFADGQVDPGDVLALGVATFSFGP